MKLKRMVVLLFSCILVLSLLTACGSNTGTNNDSGNKGTQNSVNSTTDNEEKKPKKDITLQFSIWGNDAHKAMYEGLAEKFKELQPHVNVEIMTIPFNEYQQKLSIMLSTNSAPDIAWMAEKHIPQFMGADQILPITEIKSDADYKFNEIIPATLELFEKEGELYGIPFSTPPVFLYYNKTLFDQHGLKTPQELYKENNWTYDEFLKAARTIADKDQGIFGLDYVRNAWINWHDNLTALWWSHGAKLLSDDGTQFLLNSPEGIEAMQLYHDVIFKEEIHSKPGDQTTFDTGKIAMHTDNFGYLATMAKVTEFEWDIAPLPEGVGGRGTWLGFAGYTIPKSTDHPEEALEFIKFLTTHESYLVTSEFFVPARDTVLGSDQFLSYGPSPESVKLAVLDQMADAKIKPIHENWQKIDTTIQSVLDYLHSGTVPVEEVLDLMEKEVTPLLTK